MEKKSNAIPLMIIILALAFLSVNIYDKYSVDNNQQKEYQPNYIGNIMLGLPVASRLPTSNDIDTNINIQYKDSIYRIYESRSLDKLDYGKTFVIKVA